MEYEQTLLILDDDRNILLSLELMLSDHYTNIITLENPEAIFETISTHRPDLIIMDMNYSKGAVSGQEGIALLEKIHRKISSIPVIVMTAYSEVDLAIESMKLGAVDFIQKPWQNHRLLITISNALKLNKKEKEVAQYEANAQYEIQGSEPDEFGMIGISNAIKLVKNKILKVAQSDANVLILGENGTGKELVAKAIHRHSNRAKKAFVKIDLGTIHEQLFEAELFGAKKGAYTGLTSDKPGRILMAQDGTLFLDEIGNLPLTMQSKLLSTFQNREVIPVGETHPQTINIRLVSATNMPINDLLDDQKFRQDLLYRINTIEIQIPPLRERLEDIPILMDYFIEKYRLKYQLKTLKKAPDLIANACRYSWPGNVRELQHAIERAVLMCENNTIRTDDLIMKRTSSQSSAAPTLNLEAMEKELIATALRKHSGNISKAAKELGLTRAALYRRLEKHGL